MEVGVPIAPDASDALDAPGAPALIEPSARFRIDEGRLRRHLAAFLPDFAGPIRVRQFQGGQSNPTYRIDTAAAAYVLRRRPPGVLLASAHAVDREYEVQLRLADSGLPVPTMRHYCADPDVLGQAFYVMDHVEGRVFADRRLPGCQPLERARMYAALTDTLADLHRIDVRSVGLAGFGRPEDYVQRQISRWTRQYRASKVVELPQMDRVIDWLAAQPPPAAETAIVHGDFRIGNVLFHPTEPRIVAVLDWELSTLGHPLADLAYTCLGYHLPALGGRGFGEADLAALGIPAEDEVKRAYASRTGRGAIKDWDFFLVLSLFRTAAIQVGVHRRALEGNAADARALDSSVYVAVVGAAARIIDRSRGIGG